MESLPDLWGLVWRIARATRLVHVPGFLFWLAVGGVALSARWFRHRIAT
jgi:hypothetical protein